MWDGAHRRAGDGLGLDSVVQKSPAGSSIKHEFVWDCLICMGCSAENPSWFASEIPICMERRDLYGIYRRARDGLGLDSVGAPSGERLRRGVWSEYGFSWSQRARAKMRRCLLTLIDFIRK